MIHLQRALVISFGDGAARLLGERIIQRLDNPPLIRHLFDGQLAAPDERMNVLTQALQTISAAETHHRLSEQGLHIRSQEEIAVWLLLDAATPWEADPDDVASDLRLAAWSQLRSPVHMNALIWSLPDLYQETHHIMGVMESLAVPVQAVFLVSPVTERGLIMEEGDVIDAVAYALGAMLTSPLGAISSTFQTMQRPSSLASTDPSDPAFGEVEWMAWTDASAVNAPPLQGMGAAVFENPMSRIIDWLARQWVWETSRHLQHAFLDESTPETVEPIDPLLASWRPHRLFESALLIYQTALTEDDSDLQDAPGLHRLTRLPEELHLALENQQRALQNQTTVALRDAMTPALEAWRRFLEKEEAAAFQPAADAWSMAAYRARLEAMREQWGLWADEEQERMASLQDQQRIQEAVLKTVEAEMKSIAGALSIQRPPDLIRLLTRPWRIGPLIRSYFRIPGLLQRHAQARRAWLRLEAQRLAADMVRQMSLAAAQDVTTMQDRLRIITEKIRSLADSLSAPPPFSQSPFTDDALQRLRAMTFFEGGLPLQRLLERYPLADWMDLSEMDIQERLLSFARAWLDPMNRWSATDAIAFVFEDDEKALNRWMQHFLDQAPIFWPDPHPSDPDSLALMIPCDENAAFWRMAEQQEGVHWLVRGANASPLLALRLRPISFLDIWRDRHDLSAQSFS